jgi:hypothetical protein
LRFILATPFLISLGFSAFAREAGDSLRVITEHCPA